MADTSSGGDEFPMGTLSDDELDDDMLLGGDEENKKIAAEIKRFQNQLIDAENELEENESRATAMANHLSNVRQETQQTRDLAEARKRDSRTQQDKFIVSRREKQILEKDMKAITAELQDTKDRVSSKQNQAFKSQQRIEEIKAQMKWSQKQMEDWLEEAQQKADDTQAISKYSKDDEARIKELGLEIENLTKTVNKLSTQLDKEVVETHSHEIGLDKLGILFNEVHNEHTRIVEQWEQTLQKMQERDKDIEKAAEEFQEAKNEINQRKRKLKEYETLLEEEKEANEGTEKAIGQRDRAKLSVLQQKNKLTEELTRFEAELEALKNNVAQTSAQEQRKRAEIKQLRLNLNEWEQKTEAVYGAIEMAQSEVGLVKSSTMTAEEKSSQLEQQLRMEETRLEQLMHKLDAAQVQNAKSIQKHQDARHEEHTVQSEIKSSLAVLNNLKSQMRALDKRKLDEETLLYKQQFQVAALERKLQKMEGTVVEADDREALEQKKKLVPVLDSYKKDAALLKQQLRKLEDELRLSRKNEELDAKRLTVQQGKLEELMLEIKRTEEDLKALIQKKQDKMVDENILKLDIRRRRQQLNRRADEVLSLEQQQVNLRAAMDERMEEIKIQKDILKAQVKAARDESSAVSRELKERSVRIDRLRKRHEIVVQTTGTNDGKSQAFLIVQAAQEREELQSRGDQLDTKIRKGEREVLQLERVLEKMTGKNGALRKSLKKVDNEDEDMEEKEQLEVKLQTVMDTFRHKRRERNALQTRVDAIQDQLNQLEDAISRKEEAMQAISGEQTNLDMALADQEDKIQRALNFAKQAVKTHRSQKGSTSESDVEIEFKVRHTKEFNGKMLESISSLVDKHPDIRPEVAMLLDRAGFPPLGTVRRVGGSSIGSSQSSTSSRFSRQTSSRGGTRTRTMPTSSAAAAAQSRRETAVTPKNVQLGIGGL